jgi:hypothetical protein
VRRQKTKTQHLCKNVGAELIRSNIVTHCRHAGPISRYLYRGKPSVPIGSDFLRNIHGFAQIVSNCLEIRFFIAPLFLERQAVEERHCFFHHRETIGLYRFIVCGFQTELRTHRGLAHVGFAQERSFILRAERTCHEQYL